MTDSPTAPSRAAQEAPTQPGWNSLHAAGLLGAMLLLGLLAVSIRRLVRKLADARRRLETLATTDALTGLFNRKQILARFAEECERAQRGSLGLACIKLEVDHLDQVNDRHGCPMGDEVLRMIARQARSTLRAYDVVGRFDGASFIALLPGTDLELALPIAERLRKGIEASPLLSPEGLGQAVTISLGLAQWEPKDQTEALLRRAGEALALAKASGGNRVESV